jgi:NAD(P)H-hydrate epimerase
MHAVLRVEKIREWDSYTIINEPISSIDLMERASRIFASWLIDKRFLEERKILVVVSKGNNGGDGLAVTRMLTEKFYDVDLLIADIQSKASPDFEKNLKRLDAKRIKYKYLSSGDELPLLDNYALIIDALFGSGLERPVSGYWAQLIDQINNSGKTVVSIDIPSGMYADKPSDGAVIRCDNCLSFESPKLAMLMPDNASNISNWSFESIGLKMEYLKIIRADTYYIEKRDIKDLIKPRNRFDHKGNYGHALIAGGSKGMMGAPMLAAKSCLRTGAGLVTALIPDTGYSILQTAIPEVMVVSECGVDHLSAVPDISRFSAIGIGPGMAVNEMTAGFFGDFLSAVNVPLVIDADALNILAKNRKLIEKIPAGSVLTPHPGEFDRLFGKSESGFERLDILREKAKELQLYIVLKGRYTAIATPKGIVYFNSTGNAGMATAGSGDVLTGMITSLLAQGYEPLNACLTGVFVHGLAGDIGAGQQGLRSLISTDIIDNIGNAFKNLAGIN